MAQLWLTYNEMARYFGGTASAVRKGAIENGWARMKGRDGITHVRLPPSVMTQYLAARWAITAETDHQADAMVARLRTAVAAADEAAIRTSVCAA